jgi:hypothetical protein
LSGNPVTVSPAVTTTFTVTGTDCNGCSSSGDVTVYASNNPAIVATASTNPICEGSSTTLTACCGTSSNYSWCCGLGTTNPVTVSPTVTTTYTVTGTLSGSTSTTFITVNVTPNPSITITATPDPISSGSSSTLTASGAGIYSWCCNFDTINPKVVSPTTATSYTVTGTDCNGCTNSANIAVNIITGIKTIDASTSISIYPNPASGVIQVISERYSVNSVEIYNLLGEKIYTSPITVNRLPITINIADFPNGVYVVEVRTEKGIEVDKFVKE